MVSERRLAETLARTETLECLARLTEAQLGSLGAFGDRPALWRAFRHRFSAAAHGRSAPERTVDAEFDLMESLFRLLTAEERHRGIANADWLVRLGLAGGCPWLLSEFNRWEASFPGKRNVLIVDQAGLGDHPSRERTVTGRNAPWHFWLRVETQLALQHVLDAIAGAGLKRQLRAMNAALVVEHAPECLPWEVARKLRADAEAWLNRSGFPAAQGAERDSLFAFILNRGGKGRLP
jgi:hypothetical protein